MLCVQGNPNVLLILLCVAYLAVRFVKRQQPILQPPVHDDTPSPIGSQSGKGFSPGSFIRFPEWLWDDQQTCSLHQSRYANQTISAKQSPTEPNSTRGTPKRQQPFLSPERRVIFIIVILAFLIKNEIERIPHACPSLPLAAQLMSCQTSQKAKDEYWAKDRAWQERWEQGKHAWQLAEQKCQEWVDSGNETMYLDGQAVSMIHHDSGMVLCVDSLMNLWDLEFMVPCREPL